MATAAVRQEFWRHRRTGEVYAVRLDAQGHVMGSTGPLGPGWVREDLLETFQYGPDDARWLSAHRREFTRVKFGNPDG